ncbi:MAG: RIP metalloprotease RseP [Spirochaetales bacterium]|nr:RIP metalloprotease RseP [Spirochaetales bacterium]MCF7937480.1 RIP metalloprotease RseP [Spirochaetales bacterium]
MVLKILLGLIGLGIVVMIHELGHFAAAKLSGIKVEALSLGWGRKLVGVTKGGTDYRISIFPIGGYCKMKGEEVMRKAWENDADQIEAEEGSFFSAPPWKRIFVALAGPAGNILFSFLVLTVIWMVGFSTLTFGNKIILASEYQPREKPYPAQSAGLETGDRIIRINDRKVTNWNDIQKIVAPAGENQLELTLKRDGKTLQTEVTPEMDMETGAAKIGILAWVDPVIGSVRDGSPADAAGLQAGDRITSVNGNPINNTIDLHRRLENNTKPLTVSYERSGTNRETKVTPRLNEKGTPQLGIEFKVPVYQSPEMGIFGAVARGAQETGRTLRLSLKSLGLLFSGINLQKAVSGPIRITYYVGEIASQGFQRGVGQGLSNVFSFLSLLSVALFIMNLLPIPALDGGQFILYLIEWVRGKPIRPKAIYRYQVVGFLFVFAILIFATFGDVMFLFGGP